MKTITNMFVFVLMILGVDIALAQESSLKGSNNIDETNTGINLSNHESVVDSILHRDEVLLPSAPKKMIDLPPSLLLESKGNSNPQNDESNSNNVVNDEGQQRNLSFLFRHGKGDKGSGYYGSKGGKGSHSYDSWSSSHSRSSHSSDEWNSWSRSGSHSRDYGGKSGKGSKTYYGGGKGSNNDHWTSDSHSRSSHSKDDWNSWSRSGSYSRDYGGKGGKGSKTYYGGGKGINEHWTSNSWSSSDSSDYYDWYHNSGKGGGFYGGKGGKGSKGGKGLWYPTPRTVRIPTHKPTRRPTPHPHHKPTRRPTPHPHHNPTPHHNGGDDCYDNESWRYHGEHWKNCHYIKENNLCHNYYEGQHIGREYCRKSCNYCSKHSKPNPPTRKPSRKPSRKPTRKPTHHPTRKPSRKPSRKPTRKPTHHPTRNPSRKPSRKPTRSPVKKPTRKPTKTPTGKPTHHPTPSPIKYNPHPTPSPIKYNPPHHDNDTCKNDNEYRYHHEHGKDCNWVRDNHHCDRYDEENKHIGKEFCRRSCDWCDYEDDDDHNKHSSDSHSQDDQEQCHDDTHYRYQHHEEKDCHWIKDNQHCDNLWVGGKHVGREYCRKSCDYCWVGGGDGADCEKTYFPVICDQYYKYNNFCLAEADGYTRFDCVDDSSSSSSSEDDWSSSSGDDQSDDYHWTQASDDSQHPEDHWSDSTSSDSHSSSSDSSNEWRIWSLSGSQDGGGGYYGGKGSKAGGYYDQATCHGGERWCIPLHQCVSPSALCPPCIDGYGLSCDHSGDGGSGSYFGNKGQKGGGYYSSHPGAFTNNDGLWNRSKKTLELLSDIVADETELLSDIVADETAATTRTTTIEQYLTDNDNDNDNDENNKSSSSCLVHSKCVALNLLGDCCPTDSSGIYLDCCNNHSNNNDEDEDDEDKDEDENNSNNNSNNNNRNIADNWFSLQYGSDEPEKKSYTQNHNEGW